MTEALIDLPEDVSDGNSMADWAEALLFLEDRRFISRGELKRRLGEDVGDLEVGLLLESVRTRSRRAKRAYPFEVRKNGMGRRSKTDRTLYELLLWASFSQSKVRREGKYEAIDRWFDRVALRAMKASLGRAAKGVRFGTPASDGRPTGFADALVWLAGRMQVGRTGSLPANDDKNDAGVDLMTWVPLRDQRSDMLIAIGQCTFESSWQDKAAVLNATADSWGGGWIDVGRSPITFLCVPFTYSSGAARFRELRGLVNVILDRIRICELAGRVETADRSGIQRWSRETREDLMSRASATSGRPKS